MTINVNADAQSAFEAFDAEREATRLKRLESLDTFWSNVFASQGEHSIVRLLKNNREKRENARYSRTVAINCRADELLEIRAILGISNTEEVASVQQLIRKLLPSHNRNVEGLLFLKAFGSQEVGFPSLLAGTPREGQLNDPSLAETKSGTGSGRPAMPSFHDMRIG